MWQIALSDRSAPGRWPWAVFRLAERAGIGAVVLHDEELAPARRRWPWTREDAGLWRGVSQRAEVLDYTRGRLHRLRLERLQAGVRLAAWGLSPRPPHAVPEPGTILRYTLTAAAAAAFLGARGLLLEGLAAWEPEAVAPFLQALLPALGGLRRMLLVQVSLRDLTLWKEIQAMAAFPVRPWAALDLMGEPSEGLPEVWDAMGIHVRMLMLSVTPPILEWWVREGAEGLRRAGFAGLLSVTVPASTMEEALRALTALRPPGGGRV